MTLRFSSHFLLVGLFLSSSALTPEECQPLITPLSLVDPYMMYGRTNFIMGYTDNDIYNSILKSTESSWIKITPSPFSPSDVIMSQENKINGTCFASAVNVTIDGNTATASRMVMSVGPPLWSRLKSLNSCWADCDEMCFIVHAPLRMNCNNFGDPLTFHLAPPSVGNVTSMFHVLPSCEGCLVFSINSTARNLDKFLHFMKVNSTVKEEEVTARALYLMGSESTLKDSDLEHFKQQASCLGFAREPDFHYDPKKGFCSEGEGIKMPFN